MTELFILPFDHRGSFMKIVGASSPPTEADIAKAREYKKIIFDAFKKSVAGGVPKDKAGVLVDEWLGAEILAAEDGVVVNMGNQDNYCYRGAYGKFIVVKHNNGLTTLYAHLSGQAVKVGEEVKRGQLIGYMGRTGLATGPHLHFVVYASATYSVKQSNFCGPMPIGGDMDPDKYL